MLSQVLADTTFSEVQKFPNRESKACCYSRVQTCQQKKGASHLKIKRKMLKTQTGQPQTKRKGKLVVKQVKKESSKK